MVPQAAICGRVLCHERLGQIVCCRRVRPRPSRGRCRGPVGLSLEEPSDSGFCRQSERSQLHQADGTAREPFRGTGGTRRRCADGHRARVSGAIASATSPARVHVRADREGRRGQASQTLSLVGPRNLAGHRQDAPASAGSAEPLPPPNHALRTVRTPVSHRRRRGCHQRSR